MLARTFHVSPHGKAPGDSEPFAFVTESGCAIVVLCDGAGSWGSGVEAAAAAAKRMLEPLICDGSDTVHFEQAFGIAAHCATEMSDGDDDACFSAIVAFLSTYTVKLAWAGHAGALLGRESRVVERTDVRTLADELAEGGAITRELAATHRFRHVTTTAISSGEPPRIDFAEWSIHPSDRLYLGSHFHEIAPEEHIDDAALMARHKHNVLLTVDILSGRQS